MERRNLPVKKVAYRVGILTLSDKGSCGEREDESGPLLAKMISAIADVVRYQVIADDQEKIILLLKSWVDKGFDAQRTTCAPPALSVLIRLAVSVVTCKQAAIRTPFRGFSFANRSRINRRTGILLSAHSILFLPADASRISFTSCGGCFFAMQSSP